MITFCFIPINFADEVAHTATTRDEHLRTVYFKDDAKNGNTKKVSPRRMTNPTGDLQIPRHVTNKSNKTKQSRKMPVIK